MRRAPPAPLPYGGRRAHASQPHPLTSSLRQLLHKLTFPSTRATATRFATRWPLLRLVAWPGLLIASLPYIALRGLADDTGIPRQPLALEIDRLIGLGATPTERLQSWFFSGELSAFDWFWLTVHTSWFFVPAIITGYVILFRWPLFRSLFSVRLAVFYLALLGFFLLPTEPPWMATDVTRLLDLKAGGILDVDTNPVAALPSLHVALPAAIAMWARAVGMRRWAALYALHTALTAFDVVYLGEHYVVDVLAGLALAGIVVSWAPRPTEANPESLEGVGKPPTSRRSRSWSQS